MDLAADYCIKIINEQGEEQVLYRPEPHQAKAHASETPNLLALGTRGTGKALALDTPIPTPSGFTTMADLAVGDRVIDERGRPTRVVWKSEPHIDHTGTYRLTFDDGTSIVCGGQHQWFTIAKSELKRGGSVKTTQEIVSTLKIQSGRETNHRIPLAEAWKLKTVALPLDPYVLGAWLGDGNSRIGQITAAEHEIVDQIRHAGWTVHKLTSKYLWAVEGLSSVLRALDAEEVVRVVRGVCPSCQKDRALVARGLCDRCYQTPSIRARTPKAFKGFRRFKGGVLGEKRIPDIYLRASREQRLALLQGLMDTDGSCDARQGSCEFSSTNRNLAQGVYELAISLGLKPHWGEGRAKLYGKDCGPKFRVTWTSSLPVFRLRRKLALLPTTLRTTQYCRYIVAAEELAPEMLQCIQVENASHLYLAGEAGIITHNSLWLRWDMHLRCLSCPNFRALIIRRTMPELRETHLAYIEYEMKMLGGDFLRTTFVAQYPNGSTLTFAHCETPADVMNFLGRQYGAIGFDELSTFTLDQFLMISAAARARKDEPFIAVIRASSNPLGVGADWMYEWFVDKTVDRKDYPEYDPSTFEMQFSTLEDNPHLDRKQYAARLKNLPEHIRRAWLLGERVIEGAYFTDFAPKLSSDGPNGNLGDPWHVITEMPSFKGEPLFNCEWLKVYRAVDWGYYPDPAVCLWFVVLPNSRVIVFKERTWRQTRAEEVAKAILAESEGMNIAETFADPSMFIKGGVLHAIGYSIADIFESQRLPLTPSLNDRAVYGYSIHDYLNKIIDGQPQLQILRGGGREGCPNLIRTFPLLRTDKNDPRKIADGEDHWACALAYFCIGQVPPSREPNKSTLPRWMQPKRRARVYHIQN